MPGLAGLADRVLATATSGEPRVPGVVAIATDRDENIYEGTAGVRCIDADQPMTTDTVFAVFSTTKAIAGTACLQLVEEGRLDLDAPAKLYVPELGEVQVLDGFAADGTPLLRPPKREITTRMLLTHTAGFGYDFFNETYRRLADERGLPSVISATKAALRAPLLFDPGEQWEYGLNMDWAGQVVEAVTHQRLGAVLAERVLGPLEMTSTAFQLTDEMRSRRAVLHQRGTDRRLRARPQWELPPDPEVHMAGHGLYSTAEDYCKFIRMWLNDGAGPNGRVLREETVEMATRNHIGRLKVKALPAVIAAVTNPAEFFPGMPKSWALTFMINDRDAPTGRPAGALGWAGLANLYYWIDRRTGVGGFWASQVFPFADPPAVGGYLDFEAAVYESLREAA